MPPAIGSIPTASPSEATRTEPSRRWAWRIEILASMERMFKSCSRSPEVFMDNQLQEIGIRREVLSHQRRCRGKHKDRKQRESSI